MHNIAAVKAGKSAKLCPLRKSWFVEQIQHSVEIFTRTPVEKNNKIATTFSQPRCLNRSTCKAMLAVACAQINLSKVSIREW